MVYAERLLIKIDTNSIEILLKRGSRIENRSSAVAIIKSSLLNSFSIDPNTPLDSIVKIISPICSTSLCIVIIIIGVKSPAVRDIKPPMVDIIVKSLSEVRKYRSSRRDSVAIKYIV